jgi:hypothetical protein
MLIATKPKPMKPKTGSSVGIQKPKVIKKNKSEKFNLEKGEMSLVDCKKWKTQEFG